jgi:3-dehydroquinate dehydratase-2
VRRTTQQCCTQIDLAHHPDSLSPIDLFHPSRTESKSKPPDHTCIPWKHPLLLLLLLLKKKKEKRPDMRNGKKSVLVINGPNLNLLGVREPHIYGHETLADVEASGKRLGEQLCAEVDFFQRFVLAYNQGKFLMLMLMLIWYTTSNWEGAVIDRIQLARTDGTDGIVLNPGGWTHTSVAIRDALLGVAIPFIELHVANIHGREEWRHHSYFHDKAKAVIVCPPPGIYKIDKLFMSVWMMIVTDWVIKIRPVAVSRAMTMQSITLLESFLSDRSRVRVDFTI